MDDDSTAAAANDDSRRADQAERVDRPRAGQGQLQAVAPRPGRRLRSRDAGPRQRCRRPGAGPTARRRRTKRATRDGHSPGRRGDHRRGPEPTFPATGRSAPKRSPRSSAGTRPDRTGPRRQSSGQWRRRPSHPWMWSTRGEKAPRKTAPAAPDAQRLDLVGRRLDARGERPLREDLTVESAAATTKSQLSKAEIAQLYSEILNEGVRDGLTRQPRIAEAATEPAATPTPAAPNRAATQGDWWRSWPLTARQEPTVKTLRSTGCWTSRRPPTAGRPRSSSSID